VVLQATCLPTVAAVGRTFSTGANPLNGKLLAVAGFLVFALSPSFVDFQQSPELRWQIGLYYLVGVVLVWQGLDSWAKE
jgi:hypothetical protein